MMDASESGCELVFVYGTLKRHQPNQWLWEKEEGMYEFIGEGETVEKFPLVISRSHHLPLLFQKSGVGCHIQGEVYRIDERMLKSLDVLENYPQLYDREIHAVRFTKQNTDKETIDQEHSSCDIIQSDTVLQPMKCWVYFLRKYPNEVLQKFPLVSSYDCRVTPPKIFFQAENDSEELKDITAEKVYDWLLEDCKHM